MIAVVWLIVGNVSYLIYDIELSFYRGIWYLLYQLYYWLFVIYILFVIPWYMVHICNTKYIIGREFHRSDCTGGEPALVSLRIITLARRVGGGIPTLMIFKYII